MKAILSAAMILIFACAVAAQDPGPLDGSTLTVDPAQDFEYKLDDGDWTNFLPVTVQEVALVAPDKHCYVFNVNKSLMMAWVAEFIGSTPEAPRRCDWVIDITDFITTETQRTMQMRWRNRAYVGTEYEQAGPWNESFIVRLTKLKQPKRPEAQKATEAP